MAVVRYITAGDIINRAAVECGLTPSADVFAETDPSFIQLRNLITSCGQDLVESYPWEILRREHQILTVVPPDTGVFDLPTDFGYMIPQTGWERAENVPLGGPLSPQQWSYLEGRDLVSFTIYASFRIMEDKFQIFPQPPPDGLDINFEYISREWVATGGTPTGDTVTANDEVILFKPIMIVQYLRFKFLEAKGFNSQPALAAFTKAYEQATGGNKSAPILNAGARAAGIHYLDFRNIPNTNYGGP
jgi:hypothetical protein